MRTRLLFAALCTIPFGCVAADAPLALQVLVSFALPDSTLQRLAGDAARLQLPLTVRGLHRGSMAATAERGAALLKAAPGASITIDPQPFRRHGIERVPAFVLAGPAEDCAQQCTAQPTALAIGDVTLAYALRRMASARDPHVAAAARQYLQRLGEKQ